MASPPLQIPSNKSRVHQARWQTTATATQSGRPCPPRRLCGQSSSSGRAHRTCTTKPPITPEHREQREKTHGMEEQFLALSRHLHQKRSLTSKTKAIGKERKERGARIEERKYHPESMTRTSVLTRFNNQNKGLFMKLEKQTISPLPRRVQPFPWEDLGSFLVRTTKHMGYTSPDWLLNPETSSHRVYPHTLATLESRADYDFFAQLLAISEEDLYHMTVHRFAPSIVNSHPLIEASFQRIRQEHQASFAHLIERKLLHGENVRTFLNATPFIPICPLCLPSSQAYHRLYWRMRHLFTCPLHATLLQTACSACSKKWRSFCLSPFTCPSCSQPIHQAEWANQAQMHPEFFWLHQGDSLTLHLLGYEHASGQQRNSSFLTDPRATLPPDHYFLLLHIFCKKIASLDTLDLQMFLSPSFYEWLSILTQTTDVTPKKNRLVQVAITHWIFAGGETHFFAFLDTLNFTLQFTYPSVVFRQFPWKIFPPYTQAFSLLESFHQHYRALYEGQGLCVLNDRVRQRKEAVRSSIR